MDPVKIGNLIRALRKEKGMTQLQLANRMRISDKTVSKWERGLGCPDVSLLPELSGILGIDLESLLAGELDEKRTPGGNMKKTVFYICPVCKNIIAAATAASISCCGKKLSPLEAQKAEGAHLLSIEKIENDLFLSSEHEMTKDHYISFAALISGDAILLRRQYPEWDLQLRIPMFARGKLVWYCTQHGLFYQNL